MPGLAFSALGPLFFERAQRTPHSVSMRSRPTDFLTEIVKSEKSNWVNLTFLQAFEEAELLYLGLKDAGMTPQSWIAFSLSARLEAALLWMATLGVCAPVMPLPSQASAQDLVFLLEKSPVEFIVLEGPAEVERMSEILAAQPKLAARLKAVVILEPSAMRRSASLHASFMTLFALRERGRRTKQARPLEKDAFANALHSDRPSRAVCIFPLLPFGEKLNGVEIGSGNFSASQAQLREAAPAIFEGHPDALTTLPLTDPLGILALHWAWTKGASLAFLSAKDRLSLSLEELRPEGLFLERTDLDRIILQKEEASLLGRLLTRPKLRWIVCDESQVDQRTAQALSRQKVKLLSCLTCLEATGPFAIQGQLLPGVGLKFIEKNEALLKGDLIAGRYWRQEASFSAVCDDRGWFHTGSVGQGTAKGGLHFLGRVDNLLPLSEGSSLSPETLEAALRAQSPLIQKAVISLEQSSGLSAVLLPYRERLLSFAAQENLLFSTYSALLRHPKVLEAFQDVIDKVNATHKRAEWINSFSLEEGETPGPMKAELTKQGLFR